MRGYTVAAAAVSLGIAPKALDNILIRYEVAGVSRTRQGISRKLSARSVLTLDIALRLSRSAPMPLGTALNLAAIVFEHSHSSIELEKGITLTFDLRLLGTDLDVRLAEAVEVSPAPRRGRPPLRKK